jgi:hypothetical protein
MDINELIVTPGSTNTTSPDDSIGGKPKYNKRRTNKRRTNKRRTNKRRRQYRVKGDDDNSVMTSLIAHKKNEYNIYKKLMSKQ